MKNLKPKTDVVEAEFIRRAVEIVDRIPPELFLKFLAVTREGQSPEAMIESVHKAVDDPALVQLMVISHAVGSMRISGAWSEAQAVKTN